MSPSVTVLLFNICQNCGFRTFSESSFLVLDVLLDANQEHITFEVFWWKGGGGVEEAGLGGRLAYFFIAFLYVALPAFLKFSYEITSLSKEIFLLKIKDKNEITHCIYTGMSGSKVSECEMSLENA